MRHSHAPEVSGTETGRSGPGRSGSAAHLAGAAQFNASYYTAISNSAFLPPHDAVRALGLLYCSSMVGLLCGSMSALLLLRLGFEVASLSSLAPCARACVLCACVRACVRARVRACVRRLSASDDALCARVCASDTKT